MPFLRVIQPGMLTTVQDLGRAGLTSLGIARGGAADTLSLRIANLLVGNPSDAPALEMTLTGGCFEFDGPVTVALAGGATAASIQTGTATRPLSMWTAVRIAPGERLDTGPITRGARVYLSVSGGIGVPAVLGSASTHLGAAFGGFHGRPLRAGDAVPLGASPTSLPGSHAVSPATLSRVREWLDRRALRATECSHATAVEPDLARHFWESPYTVSIQSNRVGVRLDGPVITPALTGSMASEGMMHGAVQVPPNGQPIILGVDHPTTGGYPILACIAAADLPLLGQLRPGDEVRLERISPEAARTLYLQSEALLAPSGVAP